VGKGQQKEKGKPSRSSTPAQRSEVISAAGGAVWTTSLLVPLALVVAVFLIYFPVFTYPLIDFDDPGYVGENRQVLRGLTPETISWAFRSTAEANWHPLTWLSHMLDAQLFGTNFGLHHGTSVLLHAVTSVLLFLTLRRMTGEAGKSALAAALFAVHPLRVESVAWVAERKDTLSGFLWVATMAAYAAYARRPGAPRYAAVVALFALGLLAKPMLVTLPFALLLLDYWPLRRTAPWTRLVLEKAPLFALTVISSMVTYAAQSAGGATVALPFALGTRVANAVASYGRYIGKTLWPARLSPFYPFNDLPPAWMVAAGAAVIAGGALLAWRQLRPRPYFAVGWLWYLGTLVPAIGLVQVGMQSMADRYTYIPSIGLCVIVAWAASDLISRAPELKTAAPFAAGAVILGCAIAARAQVAHWKNSVTLWNHALEVTADNFLAHTNLARHLDEQGRSDEAASHYAEALRINPKVPQALNGAGVMAQRNGRTEEAISRFKEALAVRPGFAEAHYNLGRTYYSMGKVDDALQEIQMALNSKPEYPDALNNLAVILANQGKREEALERYAQALLVNPGHVESHTNLGALLAQMGRLDEAVRHLSEAARLNPQDPRIHNNLAGVMALAGKEDQAVTEYVEAVRLNPAYVDARLRLGALLMKQKRIEDAIVQFREALRVKPDSAEARAGLAAAERMREGPSAKPLQ
jgi:tetratricopeptide (TPR) repeat protein